MMKDEGGIPDEELADLINGAEEGKSAASAAATLEIEEDHYVDNVKAKKYQIRAPCNLPPKHRFEAKTADGEVVFVIVPEGGAKKGDLFIAREAKTASTRPILGEWNDGVCPPCDGSEGQFLCLAWCLPFLAWATVMDRIGFSFVGDINPAMRGATWIIVVGCGIFMVFHFIVNPILLAPPPSPYQDRTPSGKPDASLPIMTILSAIAFWYLLIIFTLTRRAIRKKYKIPGSCCSDCLCVYCLSTCAVLQVYRHMNRSGDYIASGSCQRRVEAMEV